MESLSGVLYVTLVCYVATQVSCLTEDARDEEKLPRRAAQLSTNEGASHEASKKGSALN